MSVCVYKPVDMGMNVCLYALCIHHMSRNAPHMKKTMHLQPQNNFTLYPAGYYASTLGSTVCTPCPSGYACANPQLAPVQCSAGQVCLLAIPFRHGVLISHPTNTHIYILTTVHITFDFLLYFYEIQSNLLLTSKYHPLFN